MVSSEGVLLGCAVQAGIAGARPDFLRARRAVLDPHRVGLPDDGRLRRVPGLRREELAQLAHVSIDYVVRLEQGRTRRVSRPVLDTLADALQLAPDERTYLFAVADATHAPPPDNPPDRRSTRNCSNCSTACTTSPPWSSTAAWTYWPGTGVRQPC